MKLAHIRHTLAKALDDFKSDNAPATQVLSAIEALIEEKNALAAKQLNTDIPDLIAGTLGVSRGTAYEMMRESLAEQQGRPSFAKWTSDYVRANLHKLKTARRTWVGLTDEEIYMNCPNWLSQEQCKVWIQQVEAKLKEKNT